MLVNIVRTVVRKSLNCLKFFWLQVICCICQSNKLEHEIKHKTGGANQGEAMALPGPPLERPLGTWARQS